MFVATGIMLLHSLVPHSHHSDSQASQVIAAAQQEDSSWVNLLIDIFHFDQGNEHLENFDSGRNFGELLSPLFLAPDNKSFEFLGALDFNEPYPPIPFSLSAHSVAKSPILTLRGPPSQVI